jgi:hypothetical protein
MRFTFLMRAFSPSVGPLDTPVVCQARIWDRQRRSVRAMPRSSGVGWRARSVGLSASPRLQAYTRLKREVPVVLVVELALLSP